MAVNKGPSSGNTGEGEVGGRASYVRPSQVPWAGAPSSLNRLGSGGMSYSAASSPADPADPAKVSEWLKDADEAQCRWALGYLCNHVSVRFHEVFPGKHSRTELVGMLELLLCDVPGQIASCGKTLSWDSYEALALKAIARDGSKYLLKARNVWNQRVNRARKAAEALNTIAVNAETKRKIKALASEHSLEEDEFLSIVVDLLHERRGSVEGIIKQRKAAKKAAIASDLGLLGSSLL